VPAQQRLGPRWYTGSADAILQSMNLIYDEDPDYVVVFGADHIYRMDPEQMLQFHIDSGAGATVAGIRVPRAEATAFGCIDAGRFRPHPRVRGEARGPHPARPMTPSRRSRRWATTSSAPRCSSTPSAPTPTTTTPITTWAADIIPRLVADGMAGGVRLQRQRSARRDGSAITATGATSARWMRSTTRTWILVSVHPVFNLYNRRWPIRGEPENLAPAKFVNGGSAQESVVGAGSIISAASVRNSVLSSTSSSTTARSSRRSVIMPGVRILSLPRFTPVDRDLRAVAAGAA